MTDPLAPLGLRFREKAAGHLERLRVLASTPDDPELRLLVHSLAGAAGMFGCHALGEAAMAVDDRYAADEIPDARQLADLERRLIEIIETP